MLKGGVSVSEKYSRVTCRNGRIIYWFTETSVSKISKVMLFMSISDSEIDKCSI